VSPPPRSRSRDVRRKKGRGRDREKDRKGRKVWRSASSSSTSASSDRSRSRSRSKSKSKSKSKSRKRRTVGGTKDGATRDKMDAEYTNRRSSRSDMNMDEDLDRDGDKLAIDDIDRYKKNSELESSPSKNGNETEEIVPASGGNSDAQDLELILRQKALENFRKFRAAATMGGKTNNGGAEKEALTDDSLKNAGTKVAEATHFQSQGSLGARHSVGSPRSQIFGNGASRTWKQDNSAGMSCGAGSPGLLEPAETGGPTQLKGRAVESTRLASQFLSPLDARNGRSVMQRLVPPPGSSASVNQRLGSSAGLNHVNGAPRIRSVVSIPNRERLDGSTHTTPPRPSEDSSPVESSGKVGLPLTDTNKAEGTSVENRKTSEAPASNGSVLSPAEDKNQPRIEDKDGFQKKTFSRMHDGETVEVSYKVYIPKKTPALARRKLQR